MSELSERKHWRANRPWRRFLRRNFWWVTARGRATRSLLLELRRELGRTEL